MDHPLQAYEEDDRISTWLNSLDVSALHDGEGLEGGEYPYTEPALRADSPLEGWLSPSDANTDIIKPATTLPNALLNPSPDYARRLPSPAPPNVNEGEDEGLDAKKDEERERENEEDALRELLYHLRLPEVCTSALYGFVYSNGPIALTSTAHVLESLAPPLPTYPLPLALSQALGLCITNNVAQGVPETEPETVPPDVPHCPPELTP